MRPKNKASKPASAVSSAACVAEWPNGSICHATVGATLNSALRNRWPSVVCSTWLSQCDAASSCMHQPPLANDS